MQDIANEIAAAGAIIDIMSGGKLDWRSRIDESDFLESADWQTALAYARAALTFAQPQRSGDIPGDLDASGWTGTEQHNPHGRRR